MTAQSRMVMESFKTNFEKLQPKHYLTPWQSVEYNRTLKPILCWVSEFSHMAGGEIWYTCAESSNWFQRNQKIASNETNRTDCPLPLIT